MDVLPRAVTSLAVRLAELSWVRDLLARRRGEQLVSPKARTGWIAWRDARATTRDSCRANP